MKTLRFSVSISLCLLLSGTSLASTTIATGVIRFTGSIVEAGCSSKVGAGSRIELNDCPNTSRGTSVSVAPVRSVSALDHSSVSVKLLADSGENGRYYDQQYALVDNAGRPVHEGKYLITVTSP